MKINKIIIHCSATPNGRDDRAEDINRWHIERGFDLIGYHYVICVDGAVQAGRPEYHTGAHASGHNKNSIGICMIGTDQFSVEQWKSLTDTIIRLKGVYPDAVVIGHNEISSKDCPGFDVQKWMKELC